MHIYSAPTKSYPDENKMEKKRIYANQQESLIIMTLTLKHSSRKLRSPYEKCFKKTHIF